MNCSKKIFNKSTGQGGDETFYSDNVTYSFTFPGITKDCIIEYDYTVTTAYPFRKDVWYIQNSDPTLLNQYTLTAPHYLVQKKPIGLGWTWLYKPYNYKLPEPEYLELPNPTGSRYEQLVRFTWNLENIPAFEYESNMPAVLDYYALVRFSPSNWDSWG
ncbi:DUF3857 domain-containing protein, partial [Anaplasma marginale]|uniref:DUF3857 domain-containing protein n=1 Tax=Anaplasma marginale TaxID=770 RepID=UPI001145A8D8